MKTSQFFKKTLVVLLAAVLFIATVASSVAVTVTAASGPEVTLKSYQVTMDGQINLKFKFSSIGTAETFKVTVGSTVTEGVTAESVGEL